MAGRLHMAANSPVNPMILAQAAAQELHGRMAEVGLRVTLDSQFTAREEGVHQRWVELEYPDSWSASEIFERSIKPAAWSIVNHIKQAAQGATAIVLGELPTLPGVSACVVTRGVRLVSQYDVIQSEMKHRFDVLFRVGDVVDEVRALRAKMPVVMITDA